MSLMSMGWGAKPLCFSESYAGWDDLGKTSLERSQDVPSVIL